MSYLPEELRQQIDNFHQNRDGYFNDKTQEQIVYLQSSLLICDKLSSQGSKSQLFAVQQMLKATTKWLDLLQQRTMKKNINQLEETFYPKRQSSTTSTRQKIRPIENLSSFFKQQSKLSIFENKQEVSKGTMNNYIEISYDDSKQEQLVKKQRKGKQKEE